MGPIIGRSPNLDVKEGRKDGLKEAPVYKNNW